MSTPTPLDSLHREAAYNRLADKVEKVEVVARPKDPTSRFVVIFVRPPNSMGHYLYVEADETMEVTTAVTESCAITPDGTVLR